MDFGERIRLAREKMDISQEAAAEQIRKKYNVRLTAAYLSMIERGERKNLTINLQNALSAFFGISTLEDSYLETLAYEIDKTRKEGVNSAQIADIFGISKSLVEKLENDPSYLEKRVSKIQEHIKVTAENIVQLRKNLGLTQEQFAKSLDIDPLTLINWEDESRAVPAEYLFKIADCFDVPENSPLGMSDKKRAAISRIISMVDHNQSPLLDQNKLLKEHTPVYSKIDEEKPISPEQLILELNRALIDGNTSEKINFKRSAPKRTSLPILGIIHDETNLLSEKNIEDRIDLTEMFEGSFIIIIDSESMIHAGINNGDILICREDSEADSGEIVVLLNGLGSGTPEILLRFYIENEHETLFRAANANYSDIIAGSGNCIVGVPAAVLRNIDNLHELEEFDSNEWTEVIELASSFGLSSTNVKQILVSQIELSKKLKERMPELFTQSPPETNKKNDKS